jgi:hypothetical protein
METKEKGSYEGKCCGTVEDKQKMAEVVAKCCESAGEGGDCRSMMNGCMKKCRWFPLFGVTIGILLLLLGYYLNAEVTRILWMVAAGFVVLVGIFVLIMMSRMQRVCCGLE